MSLHLSQIFAKKLVMCRWRIPRPRKWQANSCQHFVGLDKAQPNIPYIYFQASRIFYMVAYVYNHLLMLMVLEMVWED
jgi:hypothetical protein